MNPVILFRHSLEEEGEFNVAQEIWRDSIFEYRSQIPENSLVVCRYSALPYYEELEKELRLNGSSLINSYRAHKYIANMEWAFGDLNDLTPQTWDNWSNLPDDSFVVKGRTNSRKFQWKTHMFAETRADVPNIAARLMDDTLVREQGIVVRRYHPLKKLGEGINKLPITNEWRFFVLDGKIISSGFYWSIIDEYDTQEAPREAIEIVNETIEKIPDYLRFVVIDVAQQENEDWIVIELNDGQMSGLSFNDPKILYSNILKNLTQN